MTIIELIDLALFIELLAVGIVGWMLGYKVGYTLHITRWFAHKSTS